MKPKKSNKLVIGLSITAAVLFVILCLTAGLVWFKTSHVFVDGKAYPAKAQSLDLRQEEISAAHFNALQAQLPQCQILWNVPFQGHKLSSDTQSVELIALSREDLEILKTYFPDLTTVHADASTDYDMLEALRQEMPQVTVSYLVTLGSKSFTPDTEVLELLPVDFDYDTLVENLPHLPNVKTLTFKTVALTSEQVDALKEQFPEIEISCTVAILGQEYDTTTEELDLSALTSKDVESTAQRLGTLTGLKRVELDNAEGESQLSMEEAKMLMDAAPNAVFHYTFDFYGVKISTDDEEVKINNKKIGDEGEENVRMALDMMTNCKRFVLEHCGISNEVMARIREDYRDKTKVVWRIYFGEGTSLTDAEVLRSTYNVEDDNSHDLVYLEDVKYMDIGHNEWLDYIPFVEGMKSLEVVIISGAPVHDLSPFTNCPNLRILEMANCLYVPDLEPLAQCKKLEMLNIGFTRITDLSPLDELNLTHLSGVHNKIPVEEQERFKELHPDCVTTFRGDNPYSRGWRYDANDDKLPWYEDITEVFRYPKSPNNVGWYLPDEEEE